MSKELIYKEDALELIDAARKPAERSYQGDRLKGVKSGLNIAAGLVQSIPAVDIKEGPEDE